MEATDGWLRMSNFFMRLEDWGRGACLGGGSSPSVGKNRAAWSLHLKGVSRMLQAPAWASKSLETRP